MPKEDSKKMEKEEKNIEDDNEINKYDGEF